MTLKEDRLDQQTWRGQPHPGEHNSGLDISPDGELGEVYFRYSSHRRRQKQCLKI